MTPRYEYRIWAKDLRDLGACLATQCEPLGERSSDETYLVLNVDINVKIRSEIVDIKKLIRTEKGFQLWTPILKEPFPLTAPTVQEVLVHLAGPNAPAGGAEPLEVGHFLALAEEVGAVVVTVSKRRHGYRDEGCILEFAEVTLDGYVLQTVAVESEDLPAATELATRLRINDLPNQSYPMAIRQVLRM